jgi:hypothetical protein
VIGRQVAGVGRVYSGEDRMERARAFAEKWGRMWRAGKGLGGRDSF